VASAVVPATAGAATLCGSSSAPTTAALSSTTGITKSSVTVGNVSIITGPVPGLFQGAPDGVRAYFAYINSLGGVNGRKLLLDAQDDAFLGTQNLADTKKDISTDFAMVGSFSLFDNYGCAALAQNPAVPDVSATLDPVTNALPNVFSPQPIDQGAPLAGYSFLKKKYPNAIKHVGTLVTNVSTALAQWQGQQAAMKHLGYQFSYVREYGPFESNFTTDVINMKNKGVQMVLLSDGTSSVYSTLVNEMNQQGFHPQVMMSSGTIYDPTFVPQAGGAANANGIYLIQDLSLYLGQDAKSTPAVGTFNSWMAKANPGFQPDLYSVFGWASAQLFVQALKAAGPSPTRGKVLAQLAKITSFSASGLVAPANPAKKLPPNCVLFSQILNGKFTRVAPTLSSGWDCSQPFYSASGSNLPKVSP
jgi:ABC-type branched-subunit amino acid transport system substrate-binding protein